MNQMHSTLLLKHRIRCNKGSASNVSESYYINATEFENSQYVRNPHTYF